MHSCNLPTWLFLACGVPGLALGQSQTPAANDVPIEMPEYTVTAERTVPPPESWRYTTFPGFEVLSNADDRTTREIVRDFRRFDLAMRVVWPVLRSSQVPVKLILCGTGDRFRPFIEGNVERPETGTASLLVSDREQAGLVLDLQTRVLNLIDLEDSAVPATVVTADIPEPIGDSLPGFAVNHYQQLKREYIRLLLSQVRPRAPAWLEEGLAQMFMTMQIEQRSIVFGRLSDPSALTPEEQSNEIARATADPEIGATTISAPVYDADFNKVLAQRGLMPFPEFFAVTHDSPIARNVLGSRWAKQAQAFVHMCLYGRNGRFTKGFVTFVDRLQREPLSEAMFKECFGMDYRRMGDELRGYVEFADHKYQEFRAPRGAGLPEIEDVELQDAADADVGRIKGEVLMLAGNLIAARETLINSYQRGARDPALLAALGLAESKAGKHARARRLLESAIAGGIQRPSVQVALARARLAEALANPAGPEGRISVEQAVPVMRPLFSARSMSPLLPELYDTIAEVWSHCEAKPTRENLAVLEEGARRFPQRTPLIYQAAMLHAQHGFRDSAIALAELGLKTASDPADRERFQALLRP